jgi:hypothetical protein
MPTLSVERWSLLPQFDTLAAISESSAPAKQRRTQAGLAATRQVELVVSRVEH